MAASKPSNLWTVGHLVRERLLPLLPLVGASAFKVMIDTPAAASKSQQASTGETVVNLFFYRIEPSGFYEAAGARERWYVRLFCLITVFSADEIEDGVDTHSTNVIPQGEFDLRVLGEVLRFFHENPVIDASDAMGARLEVVLNALSSQEINQIWSTQGDVPYRPSLLYEMALMPIDPMDHASPPLPVVAGGARAGTYGTMKLKNANVSDLPHAPGQSPYMESGGGTDWVPALSFVTGTTATQSLSITNKTAAVPLWIAGPVGEAVTLVWQKIEGGVWETVLESHEAVPTQPASRGNGVIDPENAGFAQIIDAVVPSTSAATNLLLFAQRRAGGAVLSTSNPLIVSIAGSSGP